MGREFRLALTQESMYMERVLPNLDPREHACTWRKSGEARPMPILESNHKTAKQRHVLIG